jgi:hypothetical protein
VPTLAAAKAHDLLKVCETIKFGYLLIFEIKEVAVEKSIYASSTITIPLKRFKIHSIFLMIFPVGLLGEQIIISLSFSSFR